MATADEILEQMEAEAQSETPVCVIDPETRTITVPPEYQLLGVENDKRVERIYFQCPKIVGDNQDLSQDYILFINYVNANGDPDAYKISDMQVDGDNITFSWLLEENVTKYKGSIQIAFAAIIPGDEAEDPDKNRWNTTINTDCTCLIGLKSTQMVAESNPDALVQIWAAIDELKAGGGGGGTPNIQIGTVQTLDPGQQATASMTGTAENPLLNLGIPKGEKGDPGEGAESGSAATPRKEMSSSDTTVTLEPNKLYVFPEMASLTVTLGTPSDTNVANEYHFFFTSGATATTLTLNDVLSDAYSIEANMKYEVSILEGVAYIKGVPISAET